MYTEGFEGLEEAEKPSHRTYGTSSELDRLQRENEKLRQSLEKEQFFNKLLDQEIQELKSSVPNAQGNYPSEYWSGSRRVSRSAFYTLLFITLAMAGYIGYGIYYDKKFDYLALGKYNAINNSNEQAKSDVADNNTSAASDQSGTTAAKSSVTPPAAASVPPPAVKDSVPNIIGANKNTATDKKTSSQKAAVAISPDEEYDEEEVNATIREETTRIVRPAPKSATTSTPPVTTSTQTGTTTARTAPVVTPPAATSAQTAAATRTEAKNVVGKYRITSKANFYNAPDENTMRSTFISESSNKVVSALEDKNGFIFVEYTNDLGFTSKGWLSKKDLTKE